VSFHSNAIQVFLVVVGFFFFFLICQGNNEGLVQLWRIEEDTLREDISTPLLTISGSYFPPLFFKFFDV
jgi:hypothetical protein